MSKQKNQTNRANGEKAAGTAELKMGVRNSSAGLKLGTGASGETAESGNRNKRS